MSARATAWLAGVGLGLASIVPVGAEAAATKVAVVDLRKCVDGYKKREAVLKELTAKMEAVKATVTGLETQIKAKEDVLDMMKKENERKAAAKEEVNVAGNQGIIDDNVVSLAVLRQTKEVQVQWFNQLKQREESKGLDLLLSDIQAAIQTVADAAGYDVVLQRNPGPVIYLREKSVVDITAAVVDQLNKTYEAALPKTADPAPPAKK